MQKQQEKDLVEKIQQIYNQEGGEEEEEVNINDYVVAEEEKEYGNYVSLLNIYTCYFKQLFRRKQDETIFDHVDYEKKNSTNKCMEFLYEEIHKFNISKEEDREMLYSPDDMTIDINLCNELYSLYINSEPLYVCKYLLPILQYLTTTEWHSIDWSIIPLKN